MDSVGMFFVHFWGKAVNIAPVDYIAQWLEVWIFYNDFM